MKHENFPGELLVSSYRWKPLIVGVLSLWILTACNSSARSGMGNRKMLVARDESGGCGEADDHSGEDSGQSLRLNESSDGGEGDQQQSSPSCETMAEPSKPEKINTSSSSSTSTATATLTRTATSTSTSTGTSTDTVARLFTAKCEGGPCHAAAGRGLENKSADEITRALRRPVMRSVVVTRDEIKMIESFLKKP